MSISSTRINHLVAARDFKYYIFDWDDNILHMPTRIYLERRQADGSWVPHTVSTSVFSIVRADTATYRPPRGQWSLAFAEFQDGRDGSENRFLRDTGRALRRVVKKMERPGPSFDTFRRTLVEGRLFAIVTARGHASETLRKGVRLFIDLVLTPDEREEMMANLRGYRACYDQVVRFGDDEAELTYYLNLNRYHAVTSPEFTALLNAAANGGATPEERKQLAIRDFVEHVVRVVRRTAPAETWRPISIGFSDDDPANVAAVEGYIQAELARHFPGVKFCVYDTSDPALENGRKITVAGQLDLGL